MNYFGEEIYLNESVTTNFEKNFENFTISPGDHKIKFRFYLSKNIPSSFDGLNGRIRYTCSAKLEQFHQFDIKCEKNFFVVGDEDLNKITGANLPILMTDVQNLYCCCFKCGEIEFRIRLPKKGFVVNETIPIYHEIYNRTKLSVNQIRLTLKQVITFYGQVSSFKSRIVSMNKATVLKRVSIPAGTDKSVLVDFLVPFVSPKLIFCNLIVVNYFLVVKIGSYVSCSIPIIIGRIPVAETLPASLS